MPKLSAYVEAACSTSGAPGGSQQQQQQPGGPAGGQCRGAWAAAPPSAQHSQQHVQPPAEHVLQQHLHGSPGEGAVPALEPQHEAAAAKLQADYSKRLREHGPRSFRWPDGSLRPDRPPPNPHAVANRRQWAPLVQHCRTHGGDRSYERTGASLRHGLGVDHAQHAAFLASVGLQPETTADGEWVGEVAGLPPPMEDPDHCFHTYYKEGAERVFKNKLGRLL